MNRGSHPSAAKGDCSDSARSLSFPGSHVSRCCWKITPEPAASERERRLLLRHLAVRIMGAMRGTQLHFGIVSQPADTILQIN